MKKFLLSLALLLAVVVPAHADPRSIMFTSNTYGYQAVTNTTGVCLTAVHMSCAWRCAVTLSKHEGGTKYVTYSLATTGSITQKYTGLNCNGKQGIYIGKGMFMDTITGSTTNGTLWYEVTP